MDQTISTISRATGGTVIRNPHLLTLQDFRNTLAGLDITRHAHKFLWDNRTEIEVAFTALASSSPCAAVRLLVALDDENSIQMTPSFWGMFLPHIEQALSRSSNGEEKALAYRDVLLAAPDIESQNDFLINHAEDLSFFLSENFGAKRSLFDLRSMLTRCDDPSVLQAYTPYLQDYFSKPRKQDELNDHVVFLVRLLAAYKHLDIDLPDYLVDARMKEMKFLISSAFNLAAKPRRGAAHMSNILAGITCLGTHPGDPVCTTEMKTPTANVKLFHLDTTHISGSTGSLYVLCQTYEESGDLRPLLLERTDCSLAAAAHAVFDLPVTPEEIRQMAVVVTPPDPDPY